MALKRGFKSVLRLQSETHSSAGSRLWDKGGPGHPDPYMRGWGGGVVSQNNNFGRPFWSKNKGGGGAGPPGPLPWTRHCIQLQNTYFPMTSLPSFAMESYSFLSSSDNSTGCINTCLSGNSTNGFPSTCWVLVRRIAMLLMSNCKRL